MCNPVAELSDLVDSIEQFGAGLGYYDSGTMKYALTFANQFGVRSVEQDVGSIAGMLMMSIPFLATVMFFGARGMASLATSMLNVGQGAAIETGREAATGNISLANASMNNFAANKWNTSAMRDTGLSTVRLPNGAFVNTNADGSTTFAGGSAVSSGGVSASFGTAVREELSERKDAALRTVAREGTEYSQAVASTAAQFTSLGASLSTSKTASSTQGMEQGTQSLNEVSQQFSNVEQFAKDNGISVDSAMRLGLHLGGGGSIGIAKGGVNRPGFTGE